MKLRPEHRQEILGVIDTMKADRVNPQIIQDTVNRYVKSRSALYAQQQAQEIERQKLANQKIEEDKKQAAQDEKERKEAEAKEVAAMTKNSDFDWRNSVTWASKNNDDIVGKFRDEYNDVDFGIEPTRGNSVVVKRPDGSTETITLDGSDSSIAQLNILKADLDRAKENVIKEGVGYNVLVGADTRARGTGKQRFENDDLRRANVAYKNIGLEINASGARKQGTLTYNIKKDGEVAFTGTADEIQGYLSNRKNFSLEDREQLEKDGLKAAEEEQKIYKQIQNSTGYTIPKETSESNYHNSKQAVRDAQILFEGVSGDGMKMIESFLNLPIEGDENYKSTRFKNLFSDEVKNRLSEEDQKIFDQAVIKSQEKDENGKTIFDRSLDRQINNDNQKIWNAKYTERLNSGDAKLLVQYGTKVKARELKINLAEEEKEIQANVEEIKSDYKKNSQQNIQNIRSVINEAKSDGVTITPKKDSNGKTLYVAKGDLASKYQPLLNTYTQKQNSLDKKYNTQLTIESNRYKNWFTNNQDNERISTFANQENDLSDIMLDQFGDAVRGIGATVPILFGSESAIAMHKSRQEGAAAYTEALDFKTAKATGQGGRYSLITLAQQAPNIMLAVATQGVGTAFNASATVASALTATSFGLNSGTSKYADLTIQHNAAIAADEKLKELEENKDFMSYEDYINQRASLEEQSALKDMSRKQIVGQSIVTGVIEGGVAFTLGTIPNASKLVKGVIKGPGDDIINAITQKNLQYYAGAGLEFGKRTLGEVLEESIIHFGDVASESVILGKDADFDGWEDVVASSIITGGAMNGPGIAYTSIMNRMHTKSDRGRFNDIKNQINSYKQELALLPNDGSNDTQIQRESLITGIQQEYQKSVGIQNEMEVGAMLLGGEGTRKLLRNGIVLDNIYNEAKVIPGDSQNVIDEKLEKHRETLSKSELKSFNNRLKIANDTRNKLLNSVDYTDGHRVWGKVGDIAHKKLLKTDPAYKKMDDKAKAAKVHEVVKDQIDQKMINEAKADPSVKALVEGQLYPDGKKKGRPTKENARAEREAYLRFGRLFGGLKAEAISVNRKEEVNAKSVIGDKRLEGLQIVEVAKDGFVDTIRDMEANGEMREGESADDLIAELRNGDTFGVIVGGKYIVTDAKAAAKNLAEGKLYQGTVFSHEVKHAADLKAFTPDEMRVYSTNLQEWTKQNAQPIHAEAVARLVGNVEYSGYDITKPFEEQSDTVHAEYGNYVQDALKRRQYKKYRDKLYKNKAGITSYLPGDFKTDTPQKAATYLSDHMQAFDRGDMGRLTKKRIDARKRDITLPDGTKVRRSSNLQERLVREYKGSKSTKAQVGALIDSMLAVDFDGNPITGDRNQITQLEYEIGGIMNNIIKRLYDPIKAENRRGVTREDFKNSLFTEAVTLIKQEYDPAVQDLDKFLSSRLNLRANSLARRLGIQQVFTSDLDNAKNVLFDDDTDVEIDDDGNIIEGSTEFTDGMNFTPEQLKAIESEVKLVLGGILPSITAEKGKNQVVSPLVSDLKKKFYEEKNPIQQAIEAAMGKTPQEIEMWLKDPKNKALILKKMPTTWLAKNLPKAVEKLVIQEDGTKEWTPDHEGLTKGTKPGQVDFYKSTEEGPYKGMTDGKQKIRRNPKAMTDITPVDIIKKFFKGKTMTDLRRGGLDTLTRAMAQEIGLEQFRANLENNSDIAKMFRSRQELLYGELGDAVVAKAIDQYERGNVLKSNAGNFDPVKAQLDMVYARGAVQVGLEFGKESDEYRSIIAGIEAESPGSSRFVEAMMDKVAGAGYSYESAGFLKLMKDLDPDGKISKLIDEGKHRVRNDKGIIEDNANDYADDILKNLAPLLDKDTFNSNLLDTFFHYRSLKAAEKNSKGVADPYYQTKQDFISKMTSKGGEAGFIINKGNSKFRTQYAPMLHTKDSLQQKLKYLSEQDFKTVGDNNIKILKNLYRALRQANVKPETVLKVLQTQSNIVNGPRGLSGIEYFMFGNFIDGTKFNQLYEGDVDGNNAVTSVEDSRYQQFIKDLSEYDFAKERLAANTEYYSKQRYTKAGKPAKNGEALTGDKLAMAAARKTYTDLLIKGEHVGPMARTNAKIGAAILNKKLTDDQFNTELDNILEDHVQFMGPNFVMDMLDKELGPTSSEGITRITKGLPNEITKNIYHTSGKLATDVIIEKQEIKELIEDRTVLASNGKNSKQILGEAAMQKYLDAENKGISILDFDDTLATSKSLVEFTRPDGTTGTLTPAQYAAEYESLADLGYKFDFSQFNRVVDGKIAPLFKKAKKLADKFGTNDIFILTARPPAAQKAIHKFLKDNGLNIPIQNITGLGNSTAEAKALWVADKAAEGYNDFYFADDALKNVQAVKNILDQFDVKSKVRQAIPTLKSSDAGKTVNEMIARNLGIAEFKEYSAAKAKLVGGKKGRYKFFIPPSAEDFKGLIYPLLGKGAKGDADMKFFKDFLFDPYSRGMQQINNMAQGLSVDFKNLNKALPKVKKKLKQKMPGQEFTYDQGLRVYMWDKAGVEIPGISKADKKAILKEITGDTELTQYADTLTKIVKSPSYIEPTDSWLTSSIPQDLHGITMGENRTGMLTEFIENRKKIFGEWQGGRLNGPLMNKLEAALGTNWRDAMEDILWRMENGTNRNFGTNKLTNRFTNWVNNSVGAIMFFNGRSAVLQTLSTVNFINWSDNNPAKAAAAFANQKQFWRDFSYLFNSDMLKQRRSGNRRSVSESEIAQAYQRGGVSGLLQKLLEFGFLPTQIADSFAIASGGATFYRNRVESLVKQGMPRVEAEKQAFTDFQKITEETQQSSRPDMISSQQASPLGRLILAFQNTPMQYARLTKKAFLDLKNGRGDAKTNISKIVYYGAAQNLIFGALQQALFRFMFDDDEEKTEGEKAAEKERATFRLLNGSIDSILRGIGVAGAIASTLKNMIIKFAEEDKKGFRMDTAAIIMEMLQLSPPVGSKVRKVNTGLRTYKFKRREIDHMNTWDIDNPVWSPVTQTISALTNIPTDRLYKKIMNLREVGNSNNENWQRIALLLGWNTWDVGVRNQEVINARGEIEELRQQAKEKEKEEKRKEKERLRKEREAREVQCSARTRKGKGPRCKNRTENKSGKCYAHQ